MKLETSLHEAMALNQRTVIVYFDLWKAYDTKWKHYIVMKMQEYGIRGNL